MPENVYLGDYEVLKKEVRVNLVRVDDVNVKKFKNKLGISGIQQLPSESASVEEEKLLFRMST